MAATTVLIHSPLVGPTSWRWVADGLSKLSHTVIVPSLLDGAAAGSWELRVDAAAAQTATGDDEVVLVGHSGAGPLLPLIGDAMKRRPRQLVFVDAGVPPEHGDTALIPDDFAAHVRSLARNGVVPPWSDWFGPEAIAALVPDAERRRAVVADMPEIPLRYFDARIILPEGWSDATNGASVLLSAIYRPDALEARSRGWPVVDLDGGHMDVVTRPAQVADAIDVLTRR